MAGCCGGNRRKSNPFGALTSRPGMRVGRPARFFGRRSSRKAASTSAPVIKVEEAPNEEIPQDPGNNPLELLPSVSPEPAEGGSEPFDGDAD